MSDTTTPDWQEAGERLASAELTARDAFAIAALQGMLAHHECDYTPMTAYAQTQAAADAYAMADAMLRARGGE